MVGYGTDDDLGDYWLVRNSWGSSYGEEGFIRVRRESTVQCGEDSTPQYGTACEDDQWMYGGGEAQEVCGQVREGKEERQFAAPSTALCCMF